MTKAQPSPNEGPLKQRLSGSAYLFAAMIIEVPGCRYARAAKIHGSL